MTSDVCEDIEQNHCQLYKDEGYCDWVENIKEQCRLTCGLCGPSTTTTTTMTSDVCEDIEQNHCQLYLDEGYCETSTAVMDQCQKTCGLCEDDDSEG